MLIKHFLFTNHKTLEEFPHEEAMHIIQHKKKLPQYAAQKLRYLQVCVPDLGPAEQLPIRVIGAHAWFDGDGQLILPYDAMNVGVDAPDFSEFEHQTCVEWALRQTIWERHTWH